MKSTNTTYHLVDIRSNYADRIHKTLSSARKDFESLRPGYSQCFEIQKVITIRRSIK